MGRGADVRGKTADKRKMEHKEEIERDNGEGSRKEKKEEKKTIILFDVLYIFLYFLLHGIL